MCTVKKILLHSVFVNIDEYEHKEGMIHISEIAPGRIRNLNDYVKEGKRIACKVLNISMQGNIDLSLRRVGTGIMIKKLNEVKQEEKAEKLLENIGKEFSYDLKKMYAEIGGKAIEKYGSLYNFLQAIVSDDKKVIAELNMPGKLGTKLAEIVKEKIKPVDVNVSGILTLRSFEGDGIITIRKLLSDLEKSGINITYLGAPKYKLQASALDYKKANSIIDPAVEKIVNGAKKMHYEASFVKSD